MKKSNLLNIAYAATISLGMLGATAHASESSLVYADDDMAIVNVGTEFNGKSSSEVELTSLYADDDTSIASLGEKGIDAAHGADIDPDLYADESLDIVQVGGGAHCKV